THVQVKWGYSSIKVRIIPTKEAWARLTSAPSASTARAPRVTNHQRVGGALRASRDRKSTRLNSSHLVISYAVFCLKKKKTKTLSLLRRLIKIARSSLRLNPVEVLSGSFSSRQLNTHTAFHRALVLSTVSAFSFFIG